MLPCATKLCAEGGIMTSTLQSIELGGQTIWVEVSDIAAPTANAAGSSNAPRSKTAKTSATGAERAADSLAKADIASTLAAIIGPVHAALAAVAPEEVSVEFALGLKGEVGVFVAKSEGNASLKITAKWKFPPGKPAQA
jgi:hypothetical protein